MWKRLFETVPLMSGENEIASGRVPYMKLKRKAVSARLVLPRNCCYRVTHLPEKLFTSSRDDDLVVPLSFLGYNKNFHCRMMGVPTNVRITYPKWSMMWSWGPGCVIRCITRALILLEETRPCRFAVSLQGLYISLHLPPLIRWHDSMSLHQKKRRKKKEVTHTYIHAKTGALSLVRLSCRLRRTQWGSVATTGTENKIFPDGNRCSFMFTLFILL